MRMYKSNEIIQGVYNCNNKKCNLVTDLNKTDRNKNDKFVKINQLLFLIN